MDSKSFILIGYSILGLIFILFNKQISDINYKLVLFYTNKLNLKDFFLYKINHKNKDSMRFLTRSFTFLLGLTIFSRNTSTKSGRLSKRLPIGSNFFNLLISD